MRRKRTARPGWIYRRAGKNSPPRLDIPAGREEQPAPAIFTSGPGRTERKTGVIFVVSGPSGSGKTTLLSQLLRDKKIKKILVKSISLTTRPKRSGEQEARDYFFVTESEFRNRRSKRKIIEWTKYLDYYYATPRDFVEGRLQKGQHIILCLDAKGALRIKKLYPKNTVIIFILPPSLEALRDRVERRCLGTKKEEIRQRLMLARQELLAARDYDYYIVNKALVQAVRRLKNIILKKLISKM